VLQMLLLKNACVHLGCTDIDIDYYLDNIDCSLATQESHKVGDKGQGGRQDRSPIPKVDGKSAG
jgi:hypothetical protein